MKMNRFKGLRLVLGLSNSSFFGHLTKFRFLPSHNIVNINIVRFCSNESVSETNLEKKNSVIDPAEKIDLSDYGSAVSSYFNFAMYADKSPLIQKYIDLGVNLYELEKRPTEAQFLSSLSIERIQPYLLFLSDISVPGDKLGKVITRNPLIFKEDLDDLRVRVNYLSSKKFDKEMIATIITKNSKWLSTPVRVIDERLGYLQQTLHLNGNEVRKMVVHTPSIGLINKKRLITNLYALKEEMGLEKHTLKKVVVSEPSLLRISSYDLVSTYEYLIKVMNVPMSLVMKQPIVLTYRKYKLSDRHKFLKSLGRAQYSHLLPGYIHLTDLVMASDSEFCNKIAKTSEKLYHDFLKTL